jgi:hypothetical protein
LVYNKDNKAKIITCARSATPHSLSYEEFKKTVVAQIGASRKPLLQGTKKGM